MTLKRENWNGKYKLVARQNGKIISVTDWNQKSQEKRDIFKQNGTFNQEIKKIKLKNVYEISDYSKNPKIDRVRGQNYNVSVTLKNGYTISASSKRYYSKKDENKAKEDALNNLYSRIDEYYDPNHESYDKDKGKRIAKKLGLNKKFRIGVKRYVNA